MRPPGRAAWCDHELVCTVNESRPRGPRREGDTRAEILVAARRMFAERGYDGTSLRGVAREAGVDAALIHHYFEGKPGLFAESVGLEIDTDAVVRIVLGVPVAEVPATILRTFLSVWDSDDARQRLLAVLGSVVSRPEAAAAFRGFVAGRVLGPITRGLGVDQPDRRAALLASQVVGLAFVRFVIRLEPVASCSTDALVRDVAPTLRRYLLDPLAA